MDTASELPTLLVVEDNPDDVFFLKRLFTKAGIKNPVDVVTDGEKAISHLGGNGSDPAQDRAADAARPPLLVFLDIKLPRRNGFEVLEWKRRQAGLSEVATVMLTSSSEDRDISRAYSLGAHSYLVKYPTASDLKQLLDAINARGERSLDQLDLPGLKRPGQ